MSIEDKMLQLVESDIATDLDWRMFLLYRWAKACRELRKSQVNLNHAEAHR